MEVIDLPNWEELEKVVQNELGEQRERKRKEDGYFSDILFRGQSDSLWELESTLERYTRRRNISPIRTWRGYHKVIRIIKPHLESVTGPKFFLHDSNDFTETRPYIAYENYAFVVYLRHYGFPSPLLDWSQSPYIAAFFAFNPPGRPDGSIAIYSYIEDMGHGNAYSPDKPHMCGLGPCVRTDKRHYLQQCEYTLCSKIENRKIDESQGDLVFCSYGDADLKDGDAFYRRQDILTKYTIPYSERDKVLYNLNLMNITEFSLFGSKESLMSTLAFRAIENLP